MTAAPQDEPRPTRATVLTMPLPRPQPSPRCEPASPPGDEHAGVDEPGYGHGV